MAQSASSKAVLITGAAGFIGNALARRLHAAGRTVVGTDIAPPAGHSDDGFRFVAADVRDLARHTALINEGCDGIIHCGGISGPMLTGDNPAEVLDINIRGTTQLLELARIFQLRRFIGCSSVSAYGNRPDRSTVTEMTPLFASTVYGSSKAVMDLVIETYAKRFGLGATALRIGWVYGPGRRTDGILRPMIRSGLGDAPFELASGEDHYLQFVHVDDVVSAMIAVFDAKGPVRTAYNINGPEAATLGGIADLVRSLTDGTRISIGLGSLPDTDLQGPMSLSAVFEDFHWAPQVSLHNGIESYAAWLRGHLF